MRTLSGRVWAGLTVCALMACGGDPMAPTRGDVGDPPTTDDPGQIVVPHTDAAPSPAPTATVDVPPAATQDSGAPEAATQRPEAAPAADAGTDARTTADAATTLDSGARADAAPMADATPAVDAAREAEPARTSCPFTDLNGVTSTCAEASFGQSYCNAQSACVACPFEGHYDCNMDGRDGCELPADDQNCGGCGHACVGFQHCVAHAAARADGTVDSWHDCVRN